MKNLYCVVGKSGTGKDTIVNELCRTYGYSRIISYTSRPKRPDPKDAQSHIFVTEDDYHRAKDTGAIVADTHFDGNYYWVTKEQADKNDFYIVDWYGYQELKKLYKGKPIKLIVINADKDVRRDRMRKRGDSAADIDKRIAHDDEAFKDVDRADTHIDIMISNNYNDNLRGVCRELYKEIQKIENPPTESVDVGVKLYNP